MSFDTLSFLFFFLPAVMVAYFAAEIMGRLRIFSANRNQNAASATWVNPLLPLQNVILLIASLFFYAWGEPVYVLLLIASSTVAWIGGCLMARLRSDGRMTAERMVMTVTVVLLVASLGVFKYIDFFITNLNNIPSFNLPLTHLSLPIGISFYTFQILSYIIDLHRGVVSVQRNPFRLLLYVSLFPQLIAGPIVRYQTVEKELTQRRFSSTDIQEGTFRFIRGLAKKILLADNVSRFSTAVYGVYTQSMLEATVPDTVGTAALWLAALAYTLQIYFDFSGYSDMAIGLGCIFGFHFLENFNLPYISRSVTEFWRRWHMSLSGWFRDYVYIPLGGNRCSKARWTLNLLIVWMLTGFWHGAGWNFILWGLFYGILLIVEKNIPWLKAGKESHMPLFSVRSITGWIYTFFIVNVGWVLFNITDADTLFGVMGRMFVWHPSSWHRMMAENSEIILSSVWIPVAFLLCFPVFGPLRRLLADRRVLLTALRIIIASALLALSYVYIVSSSFHPFIYFRF